MSYMGIRVPANIGNVLKRFEVDGEKEPLEDLHITLLFFEDLNLNDYSRALNLITKIAEDFPIFEVSTNKISTFPKNKDNLVPIFCYVKSEPLHELHEKLAKKFEKDKINFSKKYKKYNPHITLSYSSDKFDDIKIEDISFLVTELFLVYGDKGDGRVETIFKLKLNKVGNVMLGVEEFVKNAKKI